MLVDVGANLELRDGYGNTPLARATFSSRGDGEVITILLEAGANPDATNEHGNSPRSLAKMIANYDIAKLFENC